MPRREHARREQASTGGREAMERWGFGPLLPATPDRVADRLADLHAEFESAIDSGDVKRLRAAAALLDDLRAALDAASLQEVAGGNA